MSEGLQAHVHLLPAQLRHRYQEGQISEHDLCIAAGAVRENGNAVPDLDLPSPVTF